MDEKKRSDLVKFLLVGIAVTLTVVAVGEFSPHRKARKQEQYRVDTLVSEVHDWRQAMTLFWESPEGTYLHHAAEKRAQILVAETCEQANSTTQLSELAQASAIVHRNMHSPCRLKWMRFIEQHLLNQLAAKVSP